jgi:uncharacterized membrane protein YccC
MIIPSWREWLFSAKALIAALFALYLALAIPLDNPYWAMASVYIVSHPLSGATRSKAIYRALGTLIGAAASVALLAGFGQQPVMLSLGVSLWVAVLLYLSLLDRSPRSYIFLLSAYTVPLISLSVANQPASIFDVALARSEEILLGIACASLVNTTLFPSRVAPVLHARMRVLLDDGRVSIRQLLQAPAHGRIDALHRLMVDVMALDGMILHLEYDSRSHGSAQHAREFRARMAMLAPQLISLGDALFRLRQEIPDSPLQFGQLLQAVTCWLTGKEATESAESGADALLRRAYRLQARLAELNPAHRLAIEAAFEQLRALILLWRDALVLDRCFAEGHPEQGPLLRYRPLQLDANGHRDYPLLAFNALSTGTLVLLACLAWHLSGWQYGATGVFIAAVASCFFASQDNPAPFIHAFLTTTLVSISAAAVYLFALMPNVQDFGSLALLLALPLLLLGTLSGRPQYAGTTILIAVQTISTLTIQDRYAADFSIFAEAALSSTLGVVAALVWARVSRPLGTQRAARRLARDGWRSLATLALSKAPAYEPAAAEVIDRTAQLLPRLAQLSDQGAALHHAMRELRICFRLLDLKQAQRSPAIAQRLEPLLQEANRYFLACAQTAQPLAPPQSLLRLLDSCPQQLGSQPDRASHDAVQALYGLRLALFPAEPPAKPEAADATLTGAMA